MIFEILLIDILSALKSKVLRYLLYKLVVFYYKYIYNIYVFRRDKGGATPDLVQFLVVRLEIPYLPGFIRGENIKKGD